METVCHLEQSEGSAFALAFLAVIPAGNLLLPSFSQENEVFLSNASFTGQSEVSENQTLRKLCQRWTNIAQYNGVYQDFPTKRNLKRSHSPRLLLSSARRAEGPPPIRFAH